MQAARLACAFEFLSAGNNSAARMEMIAITTSNSIKVNADRRLIIADPRLDLRLMLHSSSLRRLPRSSPANSESTVALSREQPQSAWYNLGEVVSDHPIPENANGYVSI